MIKRHSSLLLLLVIAGCQSPLVERQPEFSDESSYLQYESQMASYREDGLSPKFFSQQVSRAIGKGPDLATARKHFRKGEEAFNQGAALRNRQNEGDKSEADSLFATAASSFKAAAGRWPNSALEQDALFMAAEAEFFRDRYSHANYQYEQLLKKHTNTRHIDTVMRRRYSIAMYWLGYTEKDKESGFSFNFTDETRPLRDTFGESVKILKRLRLDDPTGDLADDATLVAAHALFKKGRFDEADDLYADLRQSFPSSKLQFEAHRWGLRAKLNRYRGADYPSDLMENAAKLVKRMRTHFPQEVAKYQEEIDRADKLVRFKQAEYDWSMAKYFDDRGQYGAARFYYRSLMREYGETPFAEKAGTRLAKIEGRPAHPRKRLVWLANLFPENENAKPLIPTGSGTTLR